MSDSFLLGSLSKEQLARLIRQTKQHASDLIRQGHEEMERAQRIAELCGVESTREPKEE